MLKRHQAALSADAGDLTSPIQSPTNSRWTSLWCSQL